ncbi:MAG: SagB/ThcOx family dehydrogenase [Dehalococcoidia bacterium]|nr:SagB/ThcOx family dehydrogenase [Dehalococcoidia bacterium]
MRAADALVDARWMGQSFAGDPELALPERPRFVPELLVLPFGEDGLMVVGGRDVEVLRGRAARSFLPRLLPALDGEHTLEELAHRLPGVRPEVVRDAIALLYSRGLLEDGHPGAAPPELADLDAHFGRFIDVTRVNSNRRQAFDRLQHTTVYVGGPDGAAAELAGWLARSGVGSVRWGKLDSGLEECDLVISLAVADVDEPGSLIEAARRAGVRALHVRVGADAVQLGPLFVPGQSSCYPCMRRVHGGPIGVLDADETSFWVSFAALQVVHLLSRIALPPLYNAFQLFTFTRHGIVNETRYLTRMPGCTRCGLDGAPLAADSPAYLAWVLHCSVSLPPRDLINPREHQQHYRVGNVLLTREESEPYHGAPTVLLPDPLALAGPPPWGSDPPQAGAVDLAALATILSRAAGLNREREPGVWRVAPTGGNLDSPELFVIAEQVDGLERGIYHYHAPRHILERLHDAPADLIRRALGWPSALPRCVIVGTGALGKVYGKYQNFAYRIVYLDAGVAIAYLRDVAAALGVETREYSDILDEPLAEAISLHTRDGRFVPTFAVGLGSTEETVAPVQAADISPRVLSRLVEAAKTPGPGGDGRGRPSPGTAVDVRYGEDRALLSFGEALLNRRAVRMYAPTPLPRRLVTELMRLSIAACEERITEGAAPLGVYPWLLVQGDGVELPPGVYQADSSDAAALLLRRPGLSRAEALACVLQSSLATAPAVMFISGDMEEALEQRAALVVTASY